MTVKMAAARRFPVVFLCLALTTISGLNVLDLFDIKREASSDSKLHVLHEWEEVGETYNNNGLYPAAQSSDVMLQTLGIMRKSLWQGVSIGNVFKRHRAVTMFVLDGLSEGVAINLDSRQTIPVDQTGLNGDFVTDITLMYGGGNGADSEVERMFNGKPHTALLSANTKVLKTDDVFSTAAKYATMKSADIQSMKSLLNEKYCPDVFCIKSDHFILSSDQNLQFSLTNLADLNLLKEILMSLQFVDEISPQVSADGSPDIYIFAFSCVKDLVTEYGDGSPQIKAGIKSLTAVIRNVTNKLKELYNNAVLVQALTLYWKQNDAEHKIKVASEEAIKSLNLKVEWTFPDLEDHLNSDQRKMFCEKLITHANIMFVKETCDGLHKRVRRSRLQEDGDSGQVLNVTNLKNKAFDRSENFPAMTAIFTFIGVTMFLSLFAILYWLLTLDPAKDTIIYRLVPSRQKTD